MRSKQKYLMKLGGFQENYTSLIKEQMLPCSFLFHPSCLNHKHTGWSGGSILFQQATGLEVPAKRIKDTSPAVISLLSQS